MGAVGSTTLIKLNDDGTTNPDNQLNPEKMKDAGRTDGWVSANVDIKSSSAKVTVGIDNGYINTDGNVFGGGKGVLNSKINNLLGYAVIRGNTSVNITGNCHWKYCQYIGKRLRRRRGSCL